MNKKTIKRIRPAFTLIELLVVISIIAVLASIMMPGIRIGLLNAKITQATANARQIGIGLHAYAQDNDGVFPGKEGNSTSNEAYRELIPSYIDGETVFAVGSSPIARKADNVIEPEARILEKGENHWAYVQGLSSSSNSGWPLVVDSSDGSGNFTDQEGQPGGTWLGTKAIIVRCDTSALAVKLTGAGKKRYVPRYNDSQKNALDVRDYMGEKVKLLEPAK